MIRKHFPEFIKKLSQCQDYRKRPQYEIEELLMAVIFMFLFQKGSRNNFDNQSKKGFFRENIYKIFGLNIPDLDTSDKLLKIIKPSELEKVKQFLVSELIKRKVLDKQRVLSGYFNVTIDGTGIHSFSKEPYPGCPFKESKNGVKTWLSSVLEAKIVCSNGFSLSIATEFITNPTHEIFEKQDCELKAFKRLAVKLKKRFPRLPILITADGLYPNDTAFTICQKNNWPFIFTFKQGCIKTVWEEATLLQKTDAWKILPIYKKRKNISGKYSYINGLNYKKHQLNMVHLLEKKQHKKTNIVNETRFVHISNLTITTQNCREISDVGRMRWKIENEGFNTQKNQGYNLKHKYSRTSFTATQNYYQCIQIAHLINQLTFKTKTMQIMLLDKQTLKSTMESINAILCWIYLDMDIEVFLNRKTQLRYG